MTDHRQQIEEAVRREREVCAILAHRFTGDEELCAEIRSRNNAFDKYNTIVLEFPGFETMYNFERDLNEAVAKWGLDDEFNGTIRVTMEYVP